MAGPFFCLEGNGMEWEDPAIILRLSPHGESSLLVRALTRHRGVFHALVRGGQSRRQAALWQEGSLVVARWKARLPEQLGYMTAELVRPTASFLLDHPLSLSLLGSACGLCSEALPEREPHEALFASLAHFMGVMSVSAALPPVALYLRWELLLLEQLGYGLTLDQCAVTGVREGLAYVSPRTGRAVSEEGAGEWKDRLLPLPSCLLDDEEEGKPADWLAGARLSGHFLQRAVFAACHRPLPAARDRLMTALYRLAEDASSGQEEEERV
ncbi:DNA repair protein RecO [Parasaccharibacter sp. TMW 2.1891]|uniref:DNA repair protein RecO n=1 Tax=Parasaccharibacter sp. TMW 2.1891 TaxID=2267836 RepID=UPI002010D691|nr:DNA repair protein RecO [Parasaccharibacter sp. TMW 2.1891]